MDLVTFGLRITTGTRLGGNGGIGRQREAMDLVTFGLGITTGTRLGGNGRQLEAMDLVTFGLGITTGTRLGGNGRQRRHREATGGNGFGNFRAGDHH